MTRIEAFAAAALTGLLASPSTSQDAGADELAAAAWTLAEAMEAAMEAEAKRRDPEPITGRQR